MDAIDDTEHYERISQGPPPSLLVIILDTNPYAWSSLNPTLPLAKAVANLLVFINAHLAFSNENKVAVIASHCQQAHWLYPRPHTASKGKTDLHAVGTTSNAGAKYLPFALIEDTIWATLTTLIQNTSPADLAAPNSDCSAIAGALSLALSYINRITLAHSPSTTMSTTHSANVDNRTLAQSSAVASNSRVLVVSTSGDLAGQYIPLMNAMFAAQHSRVLIDVLKLAGDTVLLQQASFTTGGIFLAPTSSKSSEGPTTNGKSVHDKPLPIQLLPYLLHALLPAPATRAHLFPPTSPHVDFRAACFCHRNVVDTGYVCSICLSIFCEELPSTPDGTFCLICGTKLLLASDGQPVVDEDGSKKKDKKKKRKKDGTVTEEVGTPAG